LWKYTLILIHRGPEYERDFTEIVQKVVAIDPTIQVFFSSVQAKVRLPPQVWERPTLVVSLSDKFALPIKRGTVLRSVQISKLGQAKRAREGGIEVPAILPFEFGMRLDPIVFGPLVILKPMIFTSYGHVQLFRRARAEMLRPNDFPRNHVIHHDPQGYLVQKFIDTGDYPSWNRVMTFLGEPIYAVNGSLTVARPPLDSPDAVLESATVAIQGASRQREWRVDEDVMSLAKRVGQVFSEVPLLATDILRDAQSRKLYFLECNPGGNVWHFSSNQPGGINLRLQLGEADKHGEKKALELGRRHMIDQFGAFDVIARALVEKTRQAAS
jgi:hypothetical protein